MEQQLNADARLETLRQMHLDRVRRFGFAFSGGASGDDAGTAVRNMHPHGQAHNATHKGRAHDWDAETPGGLSLTVPGVQRHCVPDNASSFSPCQDNYYYNYTHDTGLAVANANSNW